MSKREDNRALVQRAFGAFQRGDLEALNSMIDPEITVMISDELANAGTWHGVDGFWQSVSSWLEAWDDYSVELVSIETPDDDHAIAEAHQRATGKTSGVPVELTTYFLFAARGGRAIRYELHASREAALASIESRRDGRE